MSIVALKDPWGEPMASDMRLLGRRAECERLDAILAGARDGVSAAVVVRGQAGAGKTALLDYLVARASGCRVARASGVESEMELPYAGLHQLCAPFLDSLDALLLPQRIGLATAFGLETGDPPDRFLVGLAVLSLLSHAAESGPLVCLIDDAQWMDQSSAQVLGFVARRLGAEGVVLAFAVRDPDDNPALAGLDELPLRALGDIDARALLDSALPGRLDAMVRDRIIAEAQGNPLALLEFPRAWSPSGLAGGFGLPDQTTMTSRIEGSFRRRLASLPDDSRRLLLVIAAEPAGNPITIRNAADRLAIPMDADEPAAASGVLDPASRLRFRHPLVRSVVYRDALPAERRLVHAALAEATDGSLDPDRRAWHRAAASAGPDEDVADELVRSAGRAQARGGLAASAAFLERSVVLTPDLATRAARALTAAQASIQTGAFESAERLLAVAEAGSLGPFERVLTGLLRAQIAFMSSRGNEVTPHLLAAARELESIDPRFARDTYLDAFSAALFGARLNEGVGIEAVASAARSAPRPADGGERAADLLLDTLTALATDYADAVVPGRAALRALSADSLGREERMRWLWQGCVVALELWDDDAAWTLSHRSVEVAREAGTLSELALALSAYSPVLVLCGDLSAASLSVAETRSVEAATGIRAAPYGAMVLAAWRGDAKETADLVATTKDDALARGEGVALAITDYARAVLANGLGSHEEAFAAARSASAFGEVVVENWGLSELFEAASRTGQLDVAVAALERLSEKAQATGTNWALGIEARSRALLADPTDAEGHFRMALDYLGASRTRAELGRTHLLFGEWLRREGRRIDARAQLRSAHELFMATGMHGFLERARRELLATGETVRARSVSAIDDLTPQEIQIGRLAGDGQTNAEIAAQLFLSPRTVEWHLRKVYDKLGVASRRDLRDALPGGTRAMVHA